MAENLTPKKYIDDSNMKQILTAVKNEISVGAVGDKYFSNAPIGVIQAFSGNTIPHGYLLANGASYKVADYPDLYAVIGNTYGGDTENFNVPTVQPPALTMVYIIKAFHTNEGVDSGVSDDVINYVDGEIAEKVDKTDIATTIDGTSTDTQVPSAKAVWDALTKEISDAPILTTADEVNSFDRAYQGFMIPSTISEEVGLPISRFKSSWFCIHLSHSHGNRYPSQIAFEYAGAKRIMYRVSVNGVWIRWIKVCTTSVEDVEWTAVTTTNTNISIDDGYIKYKVKNGICYVSVGGIRSSATGGQIISRSLPKADDTITYGSHLTSPGTGDNTGYMGTGSGGALIMNIKNTNVDLYGSFSYPVAES